MIKKSCEPGNFHHFRIQFDCHPVTANQSQPLEPLLKSNILPHHFQNKDLGDLFLRAIKTLDENVLYDIRSSISPNEEHILVPKDKNLEFVAGLAYGALRGRIVERSFKEEDFAQPGFNSKKYLKKYESDLSKREQHSSKKRGL